MNVFAVLVCGFGELGTIVIHSFLLCYFEQFN